MFLLLNRVDSPYPVLETQVLVLFLVLDSKVLVLVLDTKVLVLASNVFKVRVIDPQVLDLVLVLVTKVLINITVKKTDGILSSVYVYHRMESRLDLANTVHINNDFNLKPELFAKNS